MSDKGVSSDRQVRTLSLVIACLDAGKINDDGYQVDGRGLPVVNGIIYDPDLVSDTRNHHSRAMVDTFFNSFGSNELKRIVVRTGLSPEGLADELVDIFGIHAGATYISGITALFSATNDLAKAISDELAANPDMFNKSGQD